MKDEKRDPKTWEIGDVFALEINNPNNSVYDGKYFIFIKENERNWVNNKKIPIFRIKITPNKILPKTKDEIEELEYVQTWLVLWEERFLPFVSGPELENEIERRKNMTYYPDEFGYLSQYLISVIVTSKRQVPKNFQYLGNYMISSPKDEYVPFDLGNTCCEYFKNITSVLVADYIRYNKKDPSIYNMEHAQRIRKIAKEVHEGAIEILKQYDK